MDTSPGWAAVKLAAVRLAALFFAVSPVLVCDGCKSDALDPFMAVEQSAERAGSVHSGGSFATRPLEPDFLTSEQWYEKPPRSYAKRSDTERRWHHRRLDPYLHASAPRSELGEELLSPSPVVATNAAIVAAHWGTAQPVEHLAAAIRTAQFPLPLRCASAEALGFVEHPSTAPTLRELLKQFAAGPARPSPDATPGDEADEFDPQVTAKIPDLHATLIRALARHAQPEDEAWFTAALASTDWQVRVEGAAAWSALADQNLPPELIELRGDHDPRVRAIVVRTIAAHREPRAATYLQQSLSDSDFDVRMAAMAALEELGRAEAGEFVDLVKRQGDEIQQAVATTSRAAGGLRDNVQAAATDAQSQLGQAVAEMLEQAEQTGDQLVAQTTASAQETAEEVAAQVKTTAETTAVRLREAQRLAKSLRAANLPEAARQRAIATLGRLAMDANGAVRAQAARAMGEVADPVFLPALVAMLSDEPDVQVAAMAALVAVAGTDVAARRDGRSLSNEEKVRLWQAWYEQRGGQTSIRR